MKYRVALPVLAIVLLVSAASARAGSLRLPLTKYENGAASWVTCSSTGRIRAFYGKFGTGFSLLMTGLVGADTDGIPCSGDEPKCFLRMGNATFVFRPEVIDGVARSSHDFCGEGLFCPNGAGIPIADFSAECWDARDGDYVLPPHVLWAFAAPHSCEGLALVPIADPPGVPFAQDGVDISCPLTPGEP